MSRKNSILIILTIVLLIIGVLLFFYFSSNKAGNNATSTTPITSPFGGTPTNKLTGTSSQPVGGAQTTEVIKTTAKLSQVYKNPTSGSVFITNKDNQVLLKFVDRATGNVYEYAPGGNSSEVQRVTNTTIPKIQESVWSSSGNDLVLRYLENDTDNITSFYGRISTSSDSVGSLKELTGLFLTSNIKQLAINPKGDKIFSLVDKSDRSGTYGLITNLDGSGKKVVFGSPISYWNMSWPKENVVALTTKPSSKDSGLLYFFNPQTYSMDRILGNITGMSTLVNKNADLVAYSYSENGFFYLNVYDVINRISKNFKITTFADKCVWGNNNTKILFCAVPRYITAGEYPDSWYQGTVSFSDDIWKIDTETGKTERLYGIDSGVNTDLDIYDPKISLDDQYLSFSNKTDLSLWLFNTSL